ncbi:MAG TPA: tRNA pseudouridine(38-40) synthase TruA, partial [Calditrichaeota bacterium]|nr:tRNA pseudouridine(38-40) synthase TruA [Calditrichota bacterium]
NVSLMQTGAHLIEKHEDFKAFCKPKSDVKNYNCQIHKSKWFYKGNILVYEIAANRFLHGMVRAVVGTLIALGQGKIDLNYFMHILKSGDRTKIPLTAPAQGLVLENVIYPD